MNSIEYSSASISKRIEYPAKCKQYREIHAYAETIFTYLYLTFITFPYESAFITAK